MATVPAAAAPTAHHAGNYRVIDLGSPGGGYGGATALNERGDVVGYSMGPDEVLHPFLWRNGAMHSVGPDGLGLPVDINNHGDVLAVTDAAGPVLWRHGRTIRIGTLGGQVTLVSALNDRDQVVGQSETADGAWHAFLWQDGRMTDLGGDRATDINNRGEIVGVMLDGYTFEAFRWYRGVVTNLGPVTAGYGADPKINEAGTVMLNSNYSSSGHVYLWHAGTLTELPGLAGGTAMATALNDHGQVLGLGANAAGQPTRIVWTDGIPADLANAGISPDAAQSLIDINNHGDIAGAYYFDPGVYRPALLQPTSH